MQLSIAFENVLFFSKERLCLTNQSETVCNFIEVDKSPRREGKSFLHPQTVKAVDFEVDFLAEFRFVSGFKTLSKARGLFAAGPVRLESDRGCAAAWRYPRQETPPGEPGGGALHQQWCRVTASEPRRARLTG